MKEDVGKSQEPVSTELSYDEILRQIDDWERPIHTAKKPPRKHHHQEEDIEPASLMPAAF